MCVIGAGRRAARGESARVILAQYYPGADVTALAAPGSDAAAAAPQARAASGAGSSVGVAGSPVGVTVVVPVGSSVSAAEIERMVGRAYADLAPTLGTSVVPITVRLHGTLDSFRAATNRPWWVSHLAEGTAIDLAPAAVLAQRDGPEASVRMAVAELLVASAFRGRPVWQRVGAARYFSRSVRPEVPRAGPAAGCPSDAELILAVSAPAQRDAERRAEACFSRELTRTHDWRAVR
jgi:hypothetical protein